MNKNARTPNTQNTIWKVLRTCKVLQLINFIANLIRMCSEMPNGTYSQHLGNSLKATNI
jgi:hypothetical protein